MITYLENIVNNKKNISTSFKESKESKESLQPKKFDKAKIKSDLLDSDDSLESIQINRDILNKSNKKTKTNHTSPHKKNIINKYDSFEENEKSFFETVVTPREKKVDIVNTEIDNTIDSEEPLNKYLSEQDDDKNDIKLSTQSNHGRKKSITLNKEISSIDKDIDQLKNKLRKMIVETKGGNTKKKKYK